MKAVRFDEYGGIEVLEVRDVARPEPGPGQVLVAVRAASINPSEGAIRAGRGREGGRRGDRTRQPSFHFTVHRFR